MNASEEVLQSAPHSHVCAERLGGRAEFFKDARCVRSSTPRRVAMSRCAGEVCMIQLCVYARVRVQGSPAGWHVSDTL